MSIRRLQYQIDNVHILTFKEEYKQIVAPYFGFDNIEYGIENENSIHESIRLIFKNENVAILLRKEAIAFIYEGDVTDVKTQNGIIKIFWDLYEKIKGFKGFTRTTRHYIICHAVEIKNQEFVDSLLKGNKFMGEHPFGKVDEFASIYEFKKDDLAYKFQFGNFSKRDIKTHELRPFKTKFTEDLVDNIGIMGRLEIIEVDKNPTFTKFKALLSKAENLLSTFELVKNEK